MKNSVIIVLVIIMMLFTVPNQPQTTAPKLPKKAIAEQAEQIPDKIRTSTETAVYSEISEVESTAEELTEEAVIISETQPSERVEIAEEPTIPETEETVECIDEGDQSLAEYKPQISGQQNPFENDTPTEIDDRPVEDYIGDGEDRPGEGIHF